MNSIEDTYSYVRNLFPQKDAYYMRRMTLAYCTTQEGFTNFVENALAGVFPADTATQNAADDLDADLDVQREFFLSLLPDAEITYMRGKFKELAGKPNEIDVFIEEKIITQEYPKATEGNIPAPPTMNKMAKREVFNLESFLQAIPDPYEYFSQNNTSKSNVYKDKALDYLCKFFNVVASSDDVSEALNKNNWSLYLAYKSLIETAIEKEEGDVPHMDFEDCMLLEKEVTFIENEKVIKEFLEKKRASFEEEFALAEANGLLLECETCFSLQPSSVMKTCQDGHLFCVQCLRTAFSVSFSEGASEFMCYNENCTSNFNEDVLKAVMSPLTFSNYIRRLTSKNICEANIENMATCPFCVTYSAIPAPEDKIFKCLNPECMRESCLKCHLKSHIPYECHEKEEKGEKMRLLIESRMTNALIRNCNKCKNNFIKDDGCNRVQCPTCKTFYCYICRVSVPDDYTHFYGQGLSRYEIKGRCPLYSNLNELHVTAVAMEAQKAKNEVLEANPDIELLHDPTEILPERGPESMLPGM